MLLRPTDLPVHAFITTPSVTCPTTGGKTIPRKNAPGNAPSPFGRGSNQPAAPRLTDDHAVLISLFADLLPWQAQSTKVLCHRPFRLMYKSVVVAASGSRASRPLGTDRCLNSEASQRRDAAATLPDHVFFPGHAAVWRGCVHGEAAWKAAPRRYDQVGNYATILADRVRRVRLGDNAGRIGSGWLSNAIASTPAATFSGGVARATSDGIVICAGMRGCERCVCARGSVYRSRAGSPELPVTVLSFARGRGVVSDVCVRVGRFIVLGRGRPSYLGLVTPMHPMPRQA